MTRKSLLLLSCMTLTLSPATPILAPLMAQSGQVTGLNVMRIEFGAENPKPVMAKVAPQTWVEYRSNGEVAFRFDELARTATTVDLLDRSRNFQIRIDLSDNTLSFKDANGNKAVFNTITAAFSTPATNGSRPVEPMSKPTQTTMSNQADADDVDFDPFADPNAKQATTQSSSQKPLDNKTIITNAANKQPAFTQKETTASKTLSFDGPWVEDGVQPKKNGDGVTTAITWTVAETIYISSAADDTLTIYFDKRPADVITLRKSGENQYTGGGYAARFFGLDKTSMRLNLDSNGTRREFAIATVPSGAKLSRSRTRPEADDEIDTFTSGALIGGYNEMLTSYRSEKMDLFNPSRGKAWKIFKSPESTEFSVDPNLRSSRVPLGVNGTWFPQTEATQMESVITNMASFEKSMSLNFGASGSFKGVNSGWEATREESKGADRTDGTTKAFGLARAEVYTLFLDKPNMLLDPGFKFDILQLADGTYSADQFRRKYGTHYAASIQFGGIGKNQRTVKTTEFKNWSRESTSYKQEGGIDGGPAASIKAKGGLTMASGEAKGGSSMFSDESWKSVGGTGSVTSLGWSVDLTNAVPVRYDLRPLSELISPIFLPDEWGSSKRGALLNARNQLDAEITRYLQSQPKPDDRLIGPAVYRVTFHSLQCVNNGDDGKGDAKLYGNISAKLMGLEDELNVSLLDASEDSPQTVSCNGGAEFPINRTEFITSARGGNDASKFGRFKIVANSLFEYDPTAVDYDEQVYSPSKFQNYPGTALIDITKPMVPIEIVLREWRADQPRADIEGTQLTGGEYAPQLRIRVSFEQIQ
jgi:MAC/Perforin domain